MKRKLEVKLILT